MLADRDRAVLDIEGRFWRHAGAKEQHVVERLNMSMTRYHQLLGRLLDDPEAYAAEPVLLKRLRRLRDARRRDRPGLRVG